MNRTHAVALITALLIQIGCGSPTFLPPAPPAIKSHPVTLTESPLAEQDNSKPFNEAKTVRYANSFGGTVGLGILLGPLGAAANAGMIKAKTNQEAEGIKKVLVADPTAIFLKAAQPHKISLLQATTRSENNCWPYLLLVKTDKDGKLAVSAALILESGTGESKWTGKYFFELDTPAFITPDTQAFLFKDTQLDQHLAQAYDALLGQLAADTPESIATEKEIT